jgi:hypothetical protein
MITIKVDLPKVEFAKKRWLDKIAATQKRESVSKLRALFNKTVYGWSEKPSMGWSQVKTSESITLRVYPTGAGSDVWNMLNTGTKRHDIPITPKTGGLLRYRPGYRPATTPGQLQSRRKYRSGPYYFAKQIIDHPGIREPRRFTELIAQEYGEKYGMDMQAAVTEAANS